MKRTIFAMLTLLMLASAAIAQQRGLKLPPYKKVKLKNGMTLLLMEQHDVPLINFRLIVKTGGIDDPVGKEGLASMTADLLHRGTKNRTADQIAEQLDFIGASLSYDGQSDFTNGGAEFLKKDLATGLDLFYDTLLNPTFPQSEVEKLQKQRIDEIKESKDRAQAVIHTYFNAYLYGDHPYGRPVDGDERSIAAITRNDIVKFYQEHYGPSNTILAAAGDFSAPEMEKILTDRFGNWDRPTLVPEKKISDPEPVKGKRLLFINKPDATQTYFLIGNVGVSRLNPDRVGIDIVNTLFGVRFTSLLNSDLRIKSGYTYGASSNFDERLNAGPFYISTFTRNATTEPAIDLALDILKRLHEKGITEEQLKSTKEYIKGQFAPSIETSGERAALISGLDFYSLDEHEINDLFEKVDAFTVADANRIIEKYFPLDNLVFVLIGKGDEVGNAVKKFAPKVDYKNIADPGFK